MELQDPIAPSEIIEIKRCHVDVIKLLKGKQRVYGVHDGQFLRYAQYCTNRTARLRSLLGIKGGKGCDLSPGVFQNAEHLQIVLFTADCAWARYRDLKNSATSAKRRQHALSRLRKCQKWWKLAQECATTFSDESTQLEVDAFTTYARATLDLELGKWEESLREYSEVKAVLSELSATNDTILSNQCKEIIEDIAPLLVFCRYNLGQSDTGSIDIEIREKVRAIKSLGSSGPVNRQLTELQWRGKVYPVAHEGLKTRLSSIVEMIQDIHKSDADANLRITLYDRIIAESHGSRQLVQTLIQKSDSEDLRQIDLYLKWNSFIATIERSSTIIDTYTSPSERAEFAGRTHARIIEVKSQFENEPAIEALEKIWRSIKVINIAQTKSGAEQVAMYERAKAYSSSALKIINAESIIDPPELKSMAENILKTAREQKINAIAKTYPAPQKDIAEKAFLEDLTNYQPCSTLVQVPPEPKTVIPKPIIFDVAADFIQYPNIANKLQKKGWTSRLKFW